MQYFGFTAGVFNYHQIAITGNPFIYGWFFRSGPTSVNKFWIFPV
jgi:hypothetical protein